MYRIGILLSLMTGSSLLLQNCELNEEICETATCPPGQNLIDQPGIPCYCEEEQEMLQFTRQYSDGSMLTWKSGTINITFFGEDHFTVDGYDFDQSADAVLLLKVQSNDGSAIEQNDFFTLDDSGNSFVSYCIPAGVGGCEDYDVQVSGQVVIDRMEYPFYAKGSFEFQVTNIAETDTLVVLNGEFSMND